MFKTPIALFIFNRPDFTLQLVSILRILQPETLFVIADGPRQNTPTDILLCSQTRQVIEGIDWSCELIKKYSDVNLGCRNSIPKGLDFVFKHVESCVILEDDCIPNLSFFKFCEELLHFYRDNQTIMTISGHRSDGPNELDSDSYFFSKYPNIWGWATWKNRWEKYELEMTRWPEFRDKSWLNGILKTRDAQKYWTRIFDKMLNGLNTWDYAWVFACWVHGGLSIRPKVNMITNIGFGEGATHTHQKGWEFKFSSATEMPFPLLHPKFLEIDEEADIRIEWVSFSGMDARIFNYIRAKLIQNKLEKDA